MSLDELKAELVGDWGPLADSANTTALTLIGGRLLDEFRELIEQVVVDNVPGDIMETGVWRGGACIWAAAVLDHLGSDKQVWVCDSFQGLPAATHPKETISYDDAESLRVSEEQVKANFDRYQLRHKANFVKGWFKDTMPALAALDARLSILRMDGDMYESTDDVLRSMYDRVSPGGFVIVDDYQLPSCRQAVDELRSRRRLRGRLPVRPGVWWQKPPLVTTAA